MQQPVQQEGQALLHLAMSNPARALARAAAVLESDGDQPCLASAAHQARGIVLRDRGETAEAIRELRAALTLARPCGVERVAEVRASLGAALVMAGRTGTGLAQLKQAAAEVEGPRRAQVLVLRAYVLRFLGRYDDALEDLRTASAGFRGAGEPVWEARTLNNRGGILTALGEITRAERDVRRAERMFAAAGQDLEAVFALHNRATLAQVRGDLPAAFDYYDSAEKAYTVLGAQSGDLVIDRCQALLAAGLSEEAGALATRALDTQPLQPRHRADVLFCAATAALSGGDPTRAEGVALQARHAFVRQGRTHWVHRCDLVVAQARFQSGRPVRLPALRRTTVALLGSRVEEAVPALLLCGRIASLRGADGRAELTAAARYRGNPNPQVRATAWLALALERDLAGDRAGVLRAARQGLDTLAGFRDNLGSAQLRALATRHTEELTALALRHVLASGDARALLAWSERARTAALASPSVRPPEDQTLAARLAAMRAVARALDQARDRGSPTAELSARVSRLEADIDRRQRRARADPDAELSAPGGRAVARRSPGHLSPRPGNARPSDVGQSDAGPSDVGPGHAKTGDARRLAALQDALGETALVEIVDVDDELHAVVVLGRRVRKVRIGRADAAQTAVQRARFALRQAARGRPADLVGAGRQLEAALLGPVAGMLGEAPVVVVPTARLHPTPWALCPSLADRAVSASPSAERWLAAHRARLDGSTREQGGIALVAGPGLAGADTEVAELAAAHPDATVLHGPDATVAATLDALATAAVVHVAAHGRHRADNPMFSSLQLSDGPLTVHDLVGLRRPPGRIVLSACDSGVMAAVGTDALLGLAEALLAQGAAGVVCTVSEVNDDATRPLMQQVHAGLSAGASPAEALLRARRAAVGDPLAAATAASFISLGA